MDVVLRSVHVHAVAGAEEDLRHGFRGGLRVEVGSFILGL